MEDIKLLATKDLIGELVSRHPDGAVFVAIKKINDDDTTYTIRYTNKYTHKENLSLEQYENLVELIGYAQSRFNRKFEHLLETEEEDDL